MYRMTRRWSVAPLFSSNPLVRRSDRAEALAACLAAILAVVAIPLAALVMGNVHDSQIAAVEQQARTIQPITATAVDDATAVATEATPSGIVTAQWTHNSVTHTDTVTTDDITIDAGDPVTVWVNPRGESTLPPMTANDAAISAALAAVGFYLAAISLVIGFVVAARAIADRYRRRQWDAGLALLTGDGGDQLRH
ncbi:hypothetical protein V1Y59_11930 [Gordonia sp. PKS22-38]|uniref:Transmembrane protein n=1 Tax=Gordonia prachuapensis TaxID=3115651 RepID=A0ABU7MTY2_9ACTN|nr:hypothetical protein [Gordonia sp. PKS22-38]